MTDPITATPSSNDPPGSGVTVLSGSPTAIGVQPLLVGTEYVWHYDTSSGPVEIPDEGIMTVFTQGASDTSVLLTVSLSSSISGPLYVTVGASTTREEVSSGGSRTFTLPIPVTGSSSDTYNDYDIAGDGQSNPQMQISGPIGLVAAKRIYIKRKKA